MRRAPVGVTNQEAIAESIPENEVVGRRHCGGWHVHTARQSGYRACWRSAVSGV